MKLPKNQIFVFDDVINTESCNELIKIINEEATRKDNWSSNNNVECYPLSVAEIKDEEVRKRMDDMIFKIINPLCKIFQNEFGIPCSSDGGYTLRKIVGETRMHADGVSNDSNVNLYNKNNIRQMSVIIALNDDYDDGEFVFTEQCVRIKLKKGQLIAFPPYWTHPHKVETPMNDTVRYTINTWLCGI